MNMEHNQDETESNSFSSYEGDEDDDDDDDEDSSDEDQPERRVRFREQSSDTGTDQSHSEEESDESDNIPLSSSLVPPHTTGKGPNHRKPKQANGAIIHITEPQEGDKKTLFTFPRNLMSRLTLSTPLKSGPPTESTKIAPTSMLPPSPPLDDVSLHPLPESPIAQNFSMTHPERREKLSRLEEKPGGRSGGWGKCFPIFIGVGKFLTLLFLLYIFICSLDTLSLGFRLIGGRTAGEIFRRSDVLQNPVVGLMIGILATVFVQSSSTSTSIIVGMVAAGFLEVPAAIPLIMGANIGTSITNTIVSLSQAGDRDQFRLAFAGATILDMFNWITVLVLLPLEVVSGYLFHFSNAIMNGIMPDTQTGGDFQLLAVITNPLVDRIVQLDEEVIECWSNPICTTLVNASLIREYCNPHNITISMVQTQYDNMGHQIDGSQSSVRVLNRFKCDFLFAGTSLSDAAAGSIILICSLIVLCGCLVLIVKLLSSVIQGHMAEVIKRTLNADIPYVPWITGYIAILVGAVMTFVVQSSSVFTSSITPLIGLGVISVERAYPLTLGANVGTTTTALIASMAVEGKAFRPSMQIAVCHMLFNLSGILLFYPIPFLRLPIPMAEYLGKTTAKYRWFAIAYMVVMFALLPALTIGLSFAGPVPVIVFCALVAVLLLVIFIITVIQRKKPTLLPPSLRTWKFLPLPLRSLQPYDEFFTSFRYCRKLRDKADRKGDGNISKVDGKINENTETAEYLPQVTPYQFAEDEV